VDAVPTLIVSRVNHDGLQDAALAYVFSLIIQLGVGELGARVCRVFADSRDGQPRDFVYLDPPYL